MDENGYVWKEENYGYYVLAENITFDLSNLPMTVEEGLANFNPENIDLKEWAKTAPYEVFHNAATVAQANDFGGIFDGRGYSLNNIGLQGSMFGEAQNGAVIKNVAFNGFTKFEATKADAEAGWSKVYYKEVGGGTNAKIFSAIASADAEVTFENVYVSDPTTNDNNTYSF